MRLSDLSLGRTTEELLQVPIILLLLLLGKVSVGKEVLKHLVVLGCGVITAHVALWSRHL